MSDVPQDLNRPPPAPGPDPLAAALADLQPAPAELNRDRLMFAAGAASQRPVARLWMLTAGFLAAMGFAAGMYVRPSTVVYVERPPSAGAPARSAVPEVPPPAPERVPARSEERERSEPLPDLRGLSQRPPGDPDVARWLRVRNDVLAAGLGLLPDRGSRGGPSAPYYATPTPPKPGPPPQPRDDQE
jgi:hypothetical protein